MRSEPLLREMMIELNGGKNMEKRNIERINELAHIAKERPLTDEETEERDTLRKNYLAAFRAAFKRQLDNTVIEREDGSIEPFRGKKQ